MAKKRLLLINPLNQNRPGITMQKYLLFAPLGLTYVAGLTPAEEWDITLWDENFDPFVYQPADLVGLSALTPNANRSYQIADLYRKNNIPVVMGGIHASMLPEEALQHVDAVVVGEAETAWPKLLADFHANKLQRIYQGTWQDLKGLVRPRRDLLNPRYRFATVQYSRGCPMDCEFCSVTQFNGGRYRTRPIEEVLDEIETIPQHDFLFVDDNLTGYSAADAARVIDLFKGMVKRGIQKNWCSQASMNVASSDELLHWAFRSGCRMIFLGVEAEDPGVLQEINKKVNLKLGVNAYEDVFRRINRHGMATIGSFIYGMDHDTLETLHKRTRYLLKSRINTTMISYLTPFPGTHLHKKLTQEKRLLYTNYPADWDRYDFMDVVFTPHKMTRDELRSAVSDASTRLFSLPRFVMKFFLALWRTRCLTTAIWSFWSLFMFNSYMFVANSQAKNKSKKHRGLYSANDANNV